MPPYKLQPRLGRAVIGGMLPLVPLVLALGCGGGSKVKYELADISGKVTYNGKPVTGGRIMFIADEGGLADGGNIDEKGNYTAKAPVGNVHITVDNEALNKQRGAKAPMLRNPNAEGPSDIKGHYMAIPNKYHSIETTDLTYTVTPGAQTYDITLK